MARRTGRQATEVQRMRERDSILVRKNEHPVVQGVCGPMPVSMVHSATEARMTARDCGDCHACCIHLRLDDRPAHVRCNKLLLDGRCSCYAERPDACRDFYCLWRLGFVSEAMRPDKCGVLVHAARNQIGGHGINVVECEPGALDRELHLRDACKQLECRLVAFNWRDGRGSLYSRDAEWIADLRRKNPKLALPDDIDRIELTIDEGDKK